MRNFTITVGGVKYAVITKHFNKKVVKATIIEGLDWDSPVRFVGKAKCHPDDNFNLRAGEEMAIIRALQKRSMKIKNLKEQYAEKKFKQETEAAFAIINRCKRNWEKDKQFYGEELNEHIATPEH